MLVSHSPQLVGQCSETTTAIYNDFFAYALVDLLENEVAALLADFKKDPCDDAVFTHLEALTFFISTESTFMSESFIMHGLHPDASFSERRPRSKSRPAPSHRCCLVFSRLRLEDKDQFNSSIHRNLSNVLLTFDKTMSDFNSMADTISEIGAPLRVMLARAGLPYQPKPLAILGSAGEDDEDDEQEEEPPRKKAKVVLLHPD